MIHRVFDFGARRASEVMTPRDRIFSLDIEMPVAQLVAEIAHESFSRVPVYRRSQDNIVGILHAKDLAARRLEPSPPRVERLVRPAYFVPPGKLLADLFDEMRRGRFQIALVVNEYGRLLGLVTLEDLLEELFGEIRDEFDIEVPELTKISDDEWPASGAIGLGKLADALAPARVIEVYGGGKTLSSLILRRLGRVPRVGRKAEARRIRSHRRARARRRRRAREAPSMTPIWLIVALVGCLLGAGVFRRHRDRTGLGRRLESSRRERRRARSLASAQRIAGQSRSFARAHADRHQPRDCDRGGLAHQLSASTGTAPGLSRAVYSDSDHAGAGRVDTEAADANESALVRAVRRAAVALAGGRARAAALRRRPC